MSTQIKKRSDLPEVAKQELLELGYDLNVGDIYMVRERGSHSGHSQLYRINKISVDKKGHIESIHFGCDTNWEGTEYKNSYGSYSLDEFKRHADSDSEEWIKLSAEEIQQYNQLALDVIEGKANIEQFKDKSSDTINTNTGIIGKNTKTGLLAMQGELQNKKRQRYTKWNTDFLKNNIVNISIIL